MRISDWSSDVCSSDLTPPADSFGAVVSISAHLPSHVRKKLHRLVAQSIKLGGVIVLEGYSQAQINRNTGGPKDADMLLAQSDIEQEFPDFEVLLSREIERSEEHTSELQSLMRISYAVFCLKKKKKNNKTKLTLTNKK